MIGMRFVTPSVGNTQRRGGTEASVTGGGAVAAASGRDRARGNERRGGAGASRQRAAPYDTSGGSHLRGRGGRGKKGDGLTGARAASLARRGGTPWRRRRLRPARVEATKRWYGRGWTRVLEAPQPARRCRQRLGQLVHVHVEPRTLHVSQEPARNLLAHLGRHPPFVDLQGTAAWRR